MIPANAFTAVPQPTSFQAPYNEPYTPLQQVVRGGTAIGDASAGRQVKDWIATYAAGTIVVKPVGDVVAAFAMMAADVLTLSLAFDNNMGIVLAWKTPTGANLYYYDTLTSAYITRVFANIESCRVCVDDARAVYNANSDVIFGYVRTGNLYWRQQRDRYDTERLVAPTLRQLKRMAPSVTNRLQFELL
jgi:hypothetical protein